MIEITNLSKSYGSTKALRDLNLKTSSGKIFGFLGHNGAGKSTTLKTLVSIHNPTSGSVMVDGMDLMEHRLEIKQKIAYVPDTPDIFLQLSAGEYWSFLIAAYQLDPVAVQSRLEKLTSLFNMNFHIDETLSSFSHGMRQKAILIGALMVDPDIWILDEPMQGLDPQAAFDLKEMMKSHAQKGKTVIFSTHNLDTAQQLCDELAILKKGQLIYNGPVEKLLAEHGNRSLEEVYLEMAGRVDQPIMSDLNGEHRE
ncbi:ABC transporter ATP-binding protein [Companilactobacillus furfuricola]|uniref:ABC transporter ATP-binding protein n=1 Tax=Companilactobacillus furfuricola TaxID=1462575 RepID=UPI000F785CE0|nr:ABC transporter ATP-binding protein [Companilactobacillus furfuricola]